MTFAQWFDENKQRDNEKYYPFDNYVKTFKNAEVLRNATARDILNNAHIFYDVYPVDSVDREDAFNFASELLGLDYDVFYDAWLSGSPVPGTNLDDSKSVKEGYELLSGNKVEVYSDYDIAKKRAEELGLKEAEYGDIYRSNYSYCFWNETGDRNDEEQVIAYYTFEGGKPRPLTEDEREEVISRYEIGSFDNPLIENKSKPIKGKVIKNDGKSLEKNLTKSHGISSLNHIGNYEFEGTNKEGKPVKVYTEPVDSGGKKIRITGINESKYIKESDEETPYTKEEIERDLKSITHNFTDKEGELKCGFEEEKNFGVEILKQHYKVVETSGDDRRDGTWYHISFAEPFNKNESVDPSHLGDCPECGDKSFDTKSGKCTKCNYRESLEKANSLKESDSVGVPNIVGRLATEAYDELMERYWQKCEDLYDKLGYSYFLQDEPYYFGAWIAARNLKADNVRDKLLICKDEKEVCNLLRKYEREYEKNPDSYDAYGGYDEFITYMCRTFLDKLDMYKSSNINESKSIKEDKSVVDFVDEIEANKNNPEKCDAIYREAQKTLGKYDMNYVTDVYSKHRNVESKPINESSNNEYWYFTKHGVQPGSIPKGANVLMVQDVENGTYVKLDRVLTTKELNDYEIIEKRPEGLFECKSIKEEVEVIYQKGNKKIIKDGYGYAIDDGINANRFYVTDDGKPKFDDGCSSKFWLDKVNSLIKSGKLTSRKNEPKSIKESVDTMIYIFPELTDEDLEMLKAYGLQLLGINHGAYGDEENWVVRGQESSLRMFADKYLGYELHPDYLYNEEDFAGDIEPLKESITNSPLSTSGPIPYAVKLLWEMDNFIMSVYDNEGWLFNGVPDGEFDESTADEAMQNYTKHSWLIENGEAMFDKDEFNEFLETFKYYTKSKDYDQEERNRIIDEADTFVREYTKYNDDNSIL